MIEVTNKKNIIFEYLDWYLFQSTSYLLRAWKDILFFSFYFFSIPFLIKTLFSYWHRYRWYYDGGFNIKVFFEVLFSNTISRAIGFFMRTFIILIGIIVSFFLFMIGVITVLAWIFLPFISILFLIIGILFCFNL